MNPQQNNDEKQQTRNSLKLLTLGTELTIPIIVFALLGYWVDTEYNSQPTWMVVGLFVGLVVGVYNFWKIIRNFNRNE